MALRIFVDFDGTVARTDVGNAFFRIFGGAECDALVADYRAGALSARECFTREAAAVGTLDLAAARTFAAGQEIDPGFERFVGFCTDHGLEFTVVSDGLDFYINEILRAHGQSAVPVVANELVSGEPDAEGHAPIAVGFPNPDAECDRCACCKRNIMVSTSGDDDVIVYVGDGFSDQCAVRYADIVFAKHALETFCREENITYTTYRTFHDIVERLEELIGRGRIRRRRRAELRRRDLFEMEP